MTAIQPMEEQIASAFAKQFLWSAEAWKESNVDRDTHAQTIQIHGAHSAMDSTALASVRFRAELINLYQLNAPTEWYVWTISALMAAFLLSIVPESAKMKRGLLLTAGDF